MNEVLVIEFKELLYNALRVAYKILLRVKVLNYADAENLYRQYLPGCQCSELREGIVRWKTTKLPVTRNRGREPR